MKITSSRLGLAMSLLALATFVTSLSAAQTPSATGAARPECSGEHASDQSDGDRRAHAEERFKQEDKNGDGFLTPDEVGEKRWARIQVADANKDGKISFQELMQAFADGKLGHKHAQPPA